MLSSTNWQLCLMLAFSWPTGRTGPNTFSGKITAVLVALRLGAKAGGRFRIWSDCLGVVSKVSGLVQVYTPPHRPLPVMPTCGAKLQKSLLRSMTDFRASTKSPPTAAMQMRRTKSEGGCSIITSWSMKQLDRLTAKDQVAFGTGGTARKQFAYEELTAKEVQKVHLEVALAAR